jgi:hypothetical protein
VLKAAAEAEAAAALCLAAAVDETALALILLLLLADDDAGATKETRLILGLEEEIGAVVTVASSKFCTCNQVIRYSGS